MRITKKTVAVISLSAIAFTGTGVAYAYWTTTGSGTGSASTTEGEPNLSITGLAGSVFPGSAPATISGTVKNLADADGYVNTVTVKVKDTSDAGCDASNFSIADGTMDVKKDLAKDQSSGFSGAKLSFVNKATAQDACKGVTVHLAFTSN